MEGDCMNNVWMVQMTVKENADQRAAMLLESTETNSSTKTPMMAL